MLTVFKIRESSETQELGAYTVLSSTLFTFESFLWLFSPTPIILHACLEYLTRLLSGLSRWLLHKLLGAIAQGTSKILLYCFSCCYVCTVMRLHLSVPLSFTQSVPFKNVSRTFLNSSHSIESDRISDTEEECHYLSNSASKEGILHKAKQRGSPELSVQSFLT